MNAPTLLVVAKAPVPGLTKTRIASTVGDVAAAEVAAAALLDTLITATSVGWPVVVSMTGDLAQAVRSDEIVAALEQTRVVQQQGEGLGERLAHAHVDADAARGVVQVGMDTPQITVADYLAAGNIVLNGSRVIGRADDGGWWLLGLPDPHEAHGLVSVGMSQDDTAEETEIALGGDFEHVRTVRDMDTWEDAVDIAASLPISHLAFAVQRVQKMMAAESEPATDAPIPDAPVQDAPTEEARV
ncbi:DUF2064 domain-containing protein [Aeromicrobium sp.]|uniref:TIGR04282 family arsenosugar biosynthesis glycosyltransferase n=1 Tax=Aeromicrobium sp. TaxID=1871063 RepID=UPI0019CB9715|nr:DUF2064 domain-containing protein [Aeromicrobium sp.]MBC7633770.1 DUF2064 domain-containing protein [Aeromicrobium sp.]